MVNSPEGVRLQFDQSGVQLIKADGTLEKVEGRGSFGDVSFVVRSKCAFSVNNLDNLIINYICQERMGHDGNHERTSITIEDGPTIELAERIERGSYSVKVTDRNGISSKARGVFGAFMDADFYQV